MSIVSGLATATGVSSLLNAPRDSNFNLRQQTGEAAPLAAVRRAESRDAQVEGRAATARPVLSAGLSEQVSVAGKQSRDPRYTQFVDAVTALRIDFSEATLTRQRIAELRAAAKEVFKMDDGIPREVKPDIPSPEAAAAEARQQRADVAARRREAAEKAVEADRLEAAENRNEARLAEVRSVADAPDRVAQAPDRRAEPEVRQAPPAREEEQRAAPPPEQKRPDPAPRPEVREPAAEIRQPVDVKAAPPAPPQRPAAAVDTAPVETAEPAVADATAPDAPAPTAPPPETRVPEAAA